MSRKIKPELHHWWPRGLSKFWGNADGFAHRIDSDGDLLRSLPKAFGAIRDAHTIRLGGDKDSPWDQSFESDFDKADNDFPALARWLNGLRSPHAAEDVDFAKRLSPLIVTDQQTDTVGECLASLIVRSPGFRATVRRTTEYYRARMGMSEPAADKNLIGLNVRSAQRLIAPAMKRGKFVVLLAGEREFIFGDGFLHNISSTGNPPHNPRCLVPITPEAAIFYTRPMQYRTYPKAFVINLTPQEVAFINDTVQIYSERFLFFRDIHPVVSEEFKRGQHRQYEYHKHPWLDALEDVMANANFGHDGLFYPPASEARSHS